MSVQVTRWAGGWRDGWMRRMIMSRWGEVVGEYFMR